MKYIKNRKSFTHTDSENKKHTTTNKEMNDDVYKLRRIVMDYVYLAKKLIGHSFPRITVRIVDITVEEILKNDAPSERTSSILGFGGMGTNEIWISEHSLSGKYNIQALVFHEILHAAYAISHNENSPLMQKYIINKSIPENVLNELLLSHVNARTETEWNKKYALIFKKYL